VNKPVGIRLSLELLEARFVSRSIIGTGKDSSSYVAPVATLQAAHGVSFLCPKCYHANRGPEGTHRVTCWFEDRVPEDAQPGPGRWSPSGSGLTDLTFVPSERQPKTSVLLTGGCRWHGHIYGGHATLVPL
jgi:hypothetical protein